MSDPVDDFIKDIGKCFEGTFWGFNKLELIRTCSACPEQYNLVIDDKPAGYFRLRHGEFRVDFPECGDETVYESEEMGGDGLFDAAERGKFLAAGLKAAIDAWTESQQKPAPPKDS